MKTLLPELPDIRKVQPLGNADMLCLAEVRQVLEMHGMASRFGVSLQHQHFNINEDEILVEECDEKTRTLVILPRKRKSLGKVQAIQTNWRLDLPGGIHAMQSCTQVCEDNGSSHSSTHHRSRRIRLCTIKG